MVVDGFLRDEDRARAVIALHRQMPAARFRVKAIKDYLRKKTDTGPGHHHATATLMCILTPREHRQWRSVTPSPYTRPYPFGTSASNFGI